MSAAGATYVAIITDGNGRWAKQRGLPVEEGHRAGADAVKARLRDAVDLGIRELTVYSFSTENWARPIEEVAALMEMFSERILAETPELHDEGVRMRFIGRRTGVAPELLEQMRWAEEKTAANERITLFVAFNYGGRAEIVDAARSFSGTHRGGVPRAPVRARHARPGPDHPHERRAAALELPALAVGLLRAALHRRAVAGLRARGAGVRARRAQRAPAALRRPLMATSSRRRAQRSRRRNSASDLGARVWVAIPAVAFAIFIVASGGPVFAAGVVLLGLICLHELFRMYEALRPVRLAGFIGLIGLAAAAHFGGEHQVLLATVAFFPLLFLLALAMPERPDVPLTDGMAMTLLGTLWVGLAIAHAIMLRELPHGDGDRDRHPRRHVPRRHGGLPRRARVRHAPAGAARSRRTRRSRGSLFGIVGATLAVWCAGLYQDWLGGWNALLLGVVVGLAAPLGDLFESKIKRDAGTKDAGTLFGPTAARSTGSTRRCSPSSPGTTCGWLLL